MATYLTPLTCPSCGAKIKSSRRGQRTVCEYCGTEHLASQSLVEETPFERPPIPLPARVTLKKYAQGLRITRRWFSWKVIPMAFFCLFWDGFLIFWYIMVFSTKAPLIFAIFPVVHLSVGVAITYATLATLLNTSLIEITAKSFQVYHEPLPWSGEIQIPTRELEQLYCTQKTHHGENSDTTTYDLHAVTADGRNKTLLKGMDSPDIALYLEQQIESWLNIEDQPVSGELSRQVEIYPAG